MMHILLRSLLSIVVVSMSVAANGLDDARQFYNEKRYAEAARVIEEYLRANPSDVDALLLAGDIAMQLEQPKKAQQYYQRAYEADHDNTTAIRSYARVLSEAGEHSQALNVLRKALRSKSNDVYLRLALGQALLAADSIRAAELEITKAREMNRSIPDGFLALGDLYFSQRVYVLAKDNYEQALKLDPDNIGAHEKLALTYFRLANAETVDNALANEYYTRSLQEWSTILRRDSLYARAYYEQGKIMFYASKFPEAALSLQRYVELRPDASNATIARWYLAQSLERIGKCKEAEEYLRFTIEHIDSVRSKASLLLARCYFTTQRYSDAASLFQTIERNQPELLRQTIDREMFGYATILSGDTTQGIAILRSVVDNDSSRCRTIFRLAEFYRTSQKYDDAVVLYQRYINNCPDTLAARVYALLGTALFSANRPAEAAEVLRKSIALDSTIVFAYRMLAASEKSLGAKVDTIVRILRAGLPYATSSSDRLLLYSLYCSVLIEERRFETLQDVAQQWFKADPERAEAALYLAVGYQGIGNRDSACKYYREALRLNPTLEVARKNLKQLDCMP